MQSHQLKTSIGLTDLCRGQGGGGCSGATQRSGLKKIGSRPSFGQLQFLTVRSAQYPHFGLFGSAITHILACLVSRIPTIRSVWPHQFPHFDQYPHFGPFHLAITYISVYLVSPVRTFQSVWPG